MDPVEVLRHYPALAGARLTPLGNRGGFSGARLWRVEAAGAAFCLRRWPVDGPDADRLHWIHQLMRRGRDAGLAFVPAPLQTAEGPSLVDSGGRLWDLTPWLAGVADFQQMPSVARLAAACVALAQLHLAWATPAEPRPCPAVLRRLGRLREWQDLCNTGWRPRWAAADPVAPWAERAWNVLAKQPDLGTQCLARWRDRPLPVQPCLCDIWHDHVLFDGARVSGIVDYGSVKLDHVAVDLARLLGSLVGDQADLRREGLKAYQTLRPLTAAEVELVDDLDRTGLFLGAANWLRWLYHDGRQYPDRGAVAQRLAALVKRLEDTPAALV